MDIDKKPRKLSINTVEINAKNIDKEQSMKEEWKVNILRSYRFSAYFQQELQTEKAETMAGRKSSKKQWI